MEQPVSQFIPERELLFSCAAWCDDEASRTRFRRLAGQSLDWSWILATAERHGIVPLLRVALEQAGSSAVPEAVSNHVEVACVASAARNLQMTGELLGLLQALQEAGIESVPFKGPALAMQLFGNVASRQFRDLDILVRPEQVARARQVMASRGYTGEFELTAAREAEYLRSEHAFRFHKKQEDFIVELHWKFGSRDQAFPLSADGIWKRLRRLSFQGRSVNALSSEDLLIYLSMHGAKHGWDRLEWICSLAQLIRVGRLDWRRLFAQARETGALRGVRLGLALATEICGVQLPRAAAEQAAADPVACSLAAQARARLLADPPAQQARELRRQAFYIRTRERFADRARIVLFYWVRIPHPHSKDWELFRLPGSLSFLYYFLRPIRLLGDHGLRLLQRQDSV